VLKLRILATAQSINKIIHTAIGTASKLHNLLYNINPQKIKLG